MSHTVAEMTEQAGISYRQLDYWTTNGYLAVDDRNPGTGIYRRWPARSLMKATVAKRLIDAGIATPRAVELAEGIRALPHAIRIGPGLTLLIEPDAPESPLPELHAGGLA